MDIRSSELTKYAANAMLATKISFMNELSNVAERVGADIEHVRLGIGSDPRIGYSFIYAGAGYGGSCFPKDIRALSRTAEAFGYETQILKAVEAVNDEQKTKLFEKLDAHFGGDLRGKNIALWGLSFKPNTNDMRDAPSRTLIEALLAEEARVSAHDPKALDEAEMLYEGEDGIAFFDDPYDAAEGADALVLVTEWRQYWAPDFAALGDLMAEKVILDGRNIWVPEVVRKRGFTYYSIGRP
jgi:UDPglucose 6-dehydrogenase